MSKYQAGGKHKTTLRPWRNRDGTRLEGKIRGTEKERTGCRRGDREGGEAEGEGRISRRMNEILRGEGAGEGLSLFLGGSWSDGTHR